MIIEKVSMEWMIVFFFNKKLLNKLIDIKAINKSWLIVLIFTFKILNISNVSFCEKYSGARTIIEPLKKNKIFEKWLYLIFPKTESSFPKW